MMRFDGVRVLAPACVALTMAAVSLVAAPAPQAPRTIKDVTYATVNGRALALDLYMPAGVEHPPLLVWIHGGAWREGSKSDARLEFVEHGIATAAVDYRLSTEARFPGMVYDIKAAIRFLRAHAADYGYRADRIAIAGDSAGGHLAALVGVTNGDASLEGTEGDARNASSKVDAIVDYYGASDLTTILDQSTPHGLSVREPALKLLLGALPTDVPDLAKQASVVTHVDASDPPLLLFHGDRDPQMPVNQALELDGAYEALGLPVDLVIVHGAAHGGDVFYRGENLDHALSFLGRTIGGE
jgi:acetyl esterase/lipase